MPSSSACSCNGGTVGGGSTGGGGGGEGGGGGRATRACASSESTCIARRQTVRRRSTRRNRAGSRIERQHVSLARDVQHSTRVCVGKKKGLPWSADAALPVMSASRLVPRPAADLWSMAAAGVITERDVSSSGRIHHSAAPSSADDSVHSLARRYEEAMRRICETDDEDDPPHRTMSIAASGGTPSSPPGCLERLEALEARVDVVEQLVAALRAHIFHSPREVWLTGRRRPASR